MADPRAGKHKTVFGLLYPGDMGAALAALLKSHGFVVVTTVAGRGDESRRRAAEAGIEILDSMADVLRAADYVVSLVPPGAAPTVADQAARLAAETGSGFVFVDANSVSPMTTLGMASRLNEAGIDFVDASIHGLASRLARHGVLYLSGRAALPLAELLSGVASVRYLGVECGRASLMKMLVGGMSKGLVALFLELSLIAREGGLSEEFYAMCADKYPGVMEVAARMLPTESRHAPRRATEMQELEGTVLNLQLHPHMVTAVRQVYGLLADAVSAEDHTVPDGASVADFVERVARAQPLRRQETVSVHSLDRS